MKCYCVYYKGNPIYWTISEQSVVAKRCYLQKMLPVRDETYNEDRAWRDTGATIEELWIEKYSERLLIPNQPRR